VVSIIALLLSVIAGVSWLTIVVDLLNGAYFIAIGIVNAIAAFYLGVVRRTTTS
jgi:hypothetical protein